MKMVLNFTQSQMKNSALAQAGISGTSYGNRAGTQVHKNKRRAQQLGKVKHKTRLVHD